MFDASLPEIRDLAAVDDASLVDAIGGWSRAESAACARKLAAVAELFRRRTGLDSAEDRQDWWVDPEGAVSVELGAAMGISRGLALAQAHRAVSLRDRLPRVAALFEAGEITDLVVRAIVWRTHLIEDPEALAAVDDELAARVRRWGALTVTKTEQAIDAIVLDHDAGALRRSTAAARNRDVQFGSPTDEPGLTSLWARLYAHDGALLQQRLDEMARSVCADDRRTMAERRADAMAALGTGNNLACGCGNAACPAGELGDATSNIVVNVVVNEPTIEAATAGKPQQCTAPTAFVMSGGIMPAPLLAATLDRSTVREIRHPGDALPEPRYVPSLTLANFVRCRDLTCRFPGCDKPAQFCDIDHTVPYPVGPTHPSNLKCLCRFHHLLKTFWIGVKGWRDRQLPDGTVIWTSATGHTYTTHPGSKQLFPTLCEPTGTLWTGEPPTPDTTGDRGVMMPKRRHTRAHNTGQGHQRRTPTQRRSCGGAE